MGAVVQEPFTVEGSINSQIFDKKPGFDRTRKKIHNREKLRASLAKDKTKAGPGQAQPDSKNGKKNNKAPGSQSPEADKKNPHERTVKKEVKQEEMEGSEGEDAEHNQSRGFLEEEISSASDQKPDSQGSDDQDQDQQGLDNGKK